MIDAEEFLRHNPVTIAGGGGIVDGDGAPALDDAMPSRDALSRDRCAKSRRAGSRGGGYAQPGRMRSAAPHAGNWSVDEPRSGAEGMGNVSAKSSGAAGLGGKGDRPVRMRRPRMVGRVSVVDESLAADLDACREAALRLLEAAPRCSGGLRERLLDKGFAPETADEVVMRMVRVGLVDDEEYARSMTRHCLERQLGARGALMEMRMKSIDEADARRAVGEAREAGLFERAAYELGERVAVKTQGLDRQVRLRRFWSAGARKGHDPETLRRVAAEVFDGQ